MNYIVLDLEWNQSPIGQAGEHPRMPFEIIEIGAVKLDRNYHYVDEFRQLITPKLYPKLHKYIREILTYDERELRRNGVSFKKACQDFLDWCEDGEDEEGYVFCTWGPSDITYLECNMDFYRMAPLPFPQKFYDIQQIYAEKYSKDESVCKLEKAVRALELEMDRPFHAAVNDAYYTAKVLEKGHFGDISDKYCFDLYRHPKTREEIIMEYHDKKLDYISNEYADRRTALADSEVMSVQCSRCGRATVKRVDWFQVSRGTEYAVGKCLVHGNMLASVKVRSASDSSDRVFVVKRVVPISKKRCKEIRDKHDIIMAKREEKYQKYRDKVATEVNA